MKNKPIPVIDIFAGPGGLGEGFSALTDERGNRVFRIALSIEKDRYAHQTLELRSFFRQFDRKDVPEEYYEHLRGNISREELFSLYPLEAKKAKQEAWKAELGLTPVEETDSRIRTALEDKKTWVLIGGPPCQAYSVIGRVRQQLKDGLDKNDPRVFLYREYYRILADHSPPVFIMENVRGLLSSKLSNKLIFQKILTDLENPVESYNKLRGKRKTQSNCPGYYLFSLVRKSTGSDLEGKPDFKPEDYIIKAEDYGIPQKRHRVIILGIRKDFFSGEPGILTSKNEVIIDRILLGIPRLRSGLSKEEDSKKNWKKVIERILVNGYLNEIDSETIDLLRKTIKKIKVPKKDRGNEYIKCDANIDYEKSWFLDTKINGVCNHITRSHLNEDIHRYLFASCYANVHNKSPKLEDFPHKLLPKHKNANEGKFNDRFRVQIYGEAARTVTSHISKDGHYYIHPDPSQCRSLTVREAARIQTFPDNYFFCGSRTSQYQQVGNAVPPLLAKSIAEIVLIIIEGSKIKN